MTIGYLKDSESSISPIVPSNISKLSNLFDTILIEQSIGESAYYSDADYGDTKITSREEIITSSDLIVKITPDFSSEEYGKAKSNAIFLGQYAPYNDESIVADLTQHNVSAFSMDMIPRTSLAQSMDILSSMASIAGYQSVLSALAILPRYAPMMITAAGSIKPSKVLVLGAGVAGLQAIATARRNGAVVEAFDTRTAVKEEVQSLGAKFVEVEGAKDDKDAGGYAVEQSEEYKKRQAALIQEKAKAADVVITTAQLRGRPAPLLITEDTIKAMKPGAVVVDLAASTGGNCALSKNGETVVEHGVTIIGDSSLPAKMPQDASTLYGNNIVNFLKHIVKEGKIDLDSADEILSKSLISKKK